LYIVLCFRILEIKVRKLTSTLYEKQVTIQNSYHDAYCRRTSLDRLTLEKDMTNVSQVSVFIYIGTRSSILIG